jgi:hypothetical protein
MCLKAPLLSPEINERHKQQGISYLVSAVDMVMVRVEQLSTEFGSTKA